MGSVSYLLSGGAGVLKRYKVAATHAIGIPVIRSAANAGGITTSTTTGAANALGVTMDRGAMLNAGSDISYSTTQGDVEAVYSVLINPDAVLRYLLVTAATGTSLTSRTNGTASSGGTVVTPTPAFDYNTTNMDEGMIWCTSGSNVGLSRKITSTSTTAATVTVPFPRALAVNDVFCHVPHFYGSLGITTTTDLLSCRNDLALGTDVAMECVDLEMNGTTDSYIHLMLADHVFCGATT